MTTIKLGDEVKCIITGFTGYVTARLEYLDGTIDMAVTPGKTKDGSYPKAEYISTTRLEKISDGITIKPVERKLGFHTENKKS